MPNQVIRAALLQATWTGDKQSMLDKHVTYVERAAQQGAQVMCFQELCYGPYFCQVQDPKFYALTEPIPDGPTTRLFQELARRHRIVLIVPMYEEEQTGVYYNTAAVIDADGRYLGKYRKTHIPHLTGFWEKFYFRPGNLGYPVFETAVGKIGVYICYDRHFPEGARALGLRGAELVFNPSATARGLSMHLWKIEQTAHAIANGYFVGTINRVGQERELGPNEYYGSSYFCDPRGQFVGEVGSEKDEELLVRDLNLDLVREVRNTWQFYRDRRPELYGDLVALQVHVRRSRFCTMTRVTALSQGYRRETPGMQTMPIDTQTYVLPRHRLTVKEFHQMGEAGILGEDSRVELIEGELVDMAPIGSEHAGVVNLLNHLLSRAIGDAAIVAAQNPIVLGEHSEPQPDIVLLKPRDDFYRRSHPGPDDVLLLIEVADTSAPYDRLVKVPLYARHGIREVWILDLPQKRLEVYRQPRRDHGEYQRFAQYRDGRVSPEMLPEVALSITDLLLP